MDWYSPSEIKYSRDQCLWMIAFLLPLEAGEWLAEPVETGYTGDNQKATKSAPFEVVCCVIGELKLRLEKVSPAYREALIDEVQGYSNRNEDQLIFYEDLSRPAKQALNYISCNWRRKMSFRKWLWQKERRGNKLEYVKR